MSSPRFDAVLFDAGGVLLLPDPTVLGPLLAPYGGLMSIEAHRRAHYAAMAAKSAKGGGEHDWGVYNAAYVDVVGVSAEHRAHAIVVLAATRTAYLWRWPIPDSWEALSSLAAAGVPMGVVSNASGQVEGDLARARMCQVGSGLGVPMRVIIDSSVVGATKPDPAIFEFALAAFPGIERDRIAYVGDSVTIDVEGATAAGLHPILIDPYDDHLGAPFETIRSVGELAAELTR